MDCDLIEASEDTALWTLTRCNSNCILRADILMSKTQKLFSSLWCLCSWVTLHLFGKGNMCLWLKYRGKMLYGIILARTQKIYNIMKCPVTVYTVYSCRSLSHLSVVFFKISSVRIFPLSENIFVQEMHRKYLVVIGRPGPKTQHSGPAEHLSDVSQLETWLVWPCKGNKRSLVPAALTQTAVPGQGRHWNYDVSAWHRWVELREA